MLDFINIPDDLKDFLYLTPQFTLMKHSSHKYFIFQSQEVQLSELTRSLTYDSEKLWLQFYFDFIYNELILTKLV